MTRVFINQIAVAVPDHDVHEKYLDYAASQLANDPLRKLFRRMAGRSHISHRYSFFEPGPTLDDLDTRHFYRAGAFPNTAERMHHYQESAWELAQRACDQLPKESVAKVTHVIVTSCTGFYAPGLDFDIVRHYGMSDAVERTLIGFMGCSAAFNGMKAARHIVRSQPDAVVLMVNVELCTLHLQDTENLEDLLSFLIFADGCAASLISSDTKGIEIEGFHSAVLPESDDQLTWKVGQNGFDMVLSGQVPLSVAGYLPKNLHKILRDWKPEDVDIWAVHPGGRSILDAVETSVELAPNALDHSRKILKQYGNMSSATIMFVLNSIMNDGEAKGRGCALALGPGITAETMRFTLN